MLEHVGMHSSKSHSSETDKNLGHFDLLDRFKEFRSPLRGSLDFVNSWTYFTDPETPKFEDLTSTGPYAGTFEAFTTGQKLRRRYGHLLQTFGPTHFWSCNASRDVETAEQFADGFIGLNWTSNGAAKLHIIPETSDQGGNTLTPGDTCLNYIEDREFGRDYGYHQLSIWQDKFTAPIASRLSMENHGFTFPSLENLQHDGDVRFRNTCSW